MPNLHRLRWLGGAAAASIVALGLWMGLRRPSLELDSGESPPVETRAQASPENSFQKHHIQGTESVSRSRSFHHRDLAAYSRFSTPEEMGDGGLTPRGGGSPAGFDHPGIQPTVTEPEAGSGEGGGAPPNAEAPQAPPKPPPIAEVPEPNPVPQPEGEIPENHEGEAEPEGRAEVIRLKNPLNGEPLVEIRGVGELVPVVVSLLEEEELVLNLDSLVETDSTEEEGTSISLTLIGDEIEIRTSELLSLSSGDDDALGVKVIGTDLGIELQLPEGLGLDLSNLL